MCWWVREGPDCSDDEQGDVGNVDAETSSVGSTFKNIGHDSVNRVNVISWGGDMREWISHLHSPDSAHCSAILDDLDDNCHVDSGLLDLHS